MKIYKKISNVRKELQGSFGLGITFGNFDGVHLGHKKIIEEIMSNCDNNELELVIATFLPHPQEILCPGKKGYLINSYKQKRDLLEEIGVNHLVEINFDRDVSTLSPKEFLEKIVFETTASENDHKIRKMFLGHDFVFGKEKAGNYNFVNDYCGPLNIDVMKLGEFKFDEKRISSSLIRGLINQGNLELAESYLGRPYYCEGVVLKGDGRGKQIGFPTANILSDKSLIVPQNGVYITQTETNSMVYNSITNVGVKPTFGKQNDINIETNIFDFDKDIYGESIKVFFKSRIRSEIKFNSVNELVVQIKEDVDNAQKYFENGSNR